MKKLFVFATAVALIVIGTTSCNKVRDALFPGVDVKLPAFQFSVPAIPVVINSEASLGSFTLNFNLDSIIRANTNGVFGAGAVASVMVKEIAISVPNADQQNNLANFESVRLTLTSNAITSAAEIISINFPDTSTASYTATPTNNAELKEYIKDTQLTFSLYGKNRRVTTKSLTFNIMVTLTAK